MKVLHKPKLDPRLMTQTELIAYVHELKAENARLEEGYQKSLGVELKDSYYAQAEKNARAVTVNEQMSLW